MSSEVEVRLKEYLAEDVMGWTKGYAPDGTKIWESNSDSIEHEEVYLKWDPIENLEQAFDCLEGLGHWDWVANDPKGYQCKIHAIEYVNDTKPKAIIGAILKAEGTYEDFKEVFDTP